MQIMPVWGTFWWSLVVGILWTRARGWLSRIVMHAHQASRLRNWICVWVEKSCHPCFTCPCFRSPVQYDQDPTWWRPGKFVQIENTWVWSTQKRIGIVWRRKSSKDIDARIAKIEKRWWRQVKIRNSDCGTLTPDTGKLKQEQWLRIAGVNVVLKEDKENANSGKQKDSVR